MGGLWTALQPCGLSDGLPTGSRLRRACTPFIEKFPGIPKPKSTTIRAFPCALTYCVSILFGKCCSDEPSHSSKLLWKHVFVVELLKRRYRITEREPIGYRNFLRDIFERDDAKRRALEYLEQWGDKFWQDTEFRVRDFTTKLEQKLSGAIDAKYGPIAVSASGAKALSEEIRAEIVHKAQNIVNSNQVRELAEIVNLLADNVFADLMNRYYVVIDRLDDSWVDEAVRYKLIRALIETIRTFQRVRAVKIVVAMREDLLRRVFDQTRDAGFQEEKYESLFLRIRWKSRSFGRFSTCESANWFANNTPRSQSPSMTSFEVRFAMRAQLTMSWIDR